MKKKYSCLSRQMLLFLAGAVLLAACGVASTLPEANAGNKDGDSPIKLGPGASLGGRRLFPDDNPWNQDISREPLDPNSDNLTAFIVQVILQALKTYGMFVADNGSNWFISGAPDPRWNDAALHAIKKVKGRDLEVVKMGAIVTK